MAENQETQPAASPDTAKTVRESASAPNSAADTDHAKDQHSADHPITDTAKAAAANVAGQVKEKASGLLDDQKGKMTDGLSGVADSIRKFGENLRGAEEKNIVADTAARYGDELAEQIENFSGYLDEATIKDLSRDLEGFARRQPAVFVGGALLLGFAAARFFKSSAQPARTRRLRSGGENETNKPAAETAVSQSGS